MPRVHVLPPEVIAKIAAGEVIDRPASVIKELVENALDAGADAIAIELQEAGKTLIRVKDNGGGIEEPDIATVFERHSTSKIQTVDDLFDIHSLGFRGEALYSVAAVTDVTLRSRPPHQDTGWEIHLRGGEQQSLRPTAMTPGTELDIKELFFNTPARRKFLKSNTAEVHQILNTVIPYALLHTNVRFTLTHERKTLLDIAPADGHPSRAAKTLNLDPAHILECRGDFPEHRVTHHALLGDINIARSRRDLQFVFVNGRPVFSKALSFHLNNLYRLLLPPGSFPFFILFVEMPAEDLDVNIHPTKREVKIRDEQLIWHLLKPLCEEALMRAGGTKQARWEPVGPAENTGPSIVPRALASTHPKEETANFAPAQDIFEPRHGTPRSPQPSTEEYAVPAARELFGVAEEARPLSSRGLLAQLSEARYIGAFIHKFLLFESGKSLLLVDQHAAQERITFERLITQLNKGQVEVQHLLSPYLMKLTPQDILVWEQAQTALEEIGFASTQFDEETIAVHSSPLLLKDPVRAVRDLLAGGDVARADHEKMARLACRSSIMTGDRLDPVQAEHQRRELLACRDPFTCPHGRPTVIELTETFLDRQFLRT